MNAKESTQIIEIDSDEYFLRWRIEEHLATVAVTEILFRDDQGRPQFRCNEDSRHETGDPDSAETILVARIKWDGCADWDLGYYHTCGADNLVSYFKLLQFVFLQGLKYMGCEDESPWPEEVNLG